MPHLAAPDTDTTESAALRRCVKQFYDWFNSEDWDKCYAAVDSRLTATAKCERTPYVNSLKAFKRHFGSVTPTRIEPSVHMDASTNKHDDRPFAYVQVEWRDSRNEEHSFRERWVKDAGRWSTRVAGLVVNAQPPQSNNGH